jgi:hypothetical protein
MYVYCLIIFIFLAVRCADVCVCRDRLRRPPCLAPLSHLPPSTQSLLEEGAEGPTSPHTSPHALGEGQKLRRQLEVSQTSIHQVGPPVWSQRLDLFLYMRPGKARWDISPPASVHTLALALPACPRSMLDASDRLLDGRLCVVQVEWQLQRDMEWVSSRIRSKHQRAKLLAIR